MHPYVCPLIRSPDDRVRAIATAMGLKISIWTATPSGLKLDTNGKLSLLTVSYTLC